MQQLEGLVELELADDPDRVMEKLREKLPECPNCTGVSVGRHAELFVPEDQQRVWSPWLSVTAPEDTVITDPGAEPLPGSGATVTDSGLGDVMGALTLYDLYVSDSADFVVDVTGKIKFATADEEKGLGIGENDYTLQFDAYKFFDRLSLQGTAGYRLRGEALAVKIAGLHVGQVVEMSIREAFDWCETVPAHLTAQKNEIARAILKEIRERLGFLNNVGLEYLTLSRNAGTLSGGESQRIRLASQIGSGLTGVLYVLDEPSIGLHQRGDAVGQVALGRGRHWPRQDSQLVGQLIGQELLQIQRFHQLVRSSGADRLRDRRVLKNRGHPFDEEVAVRQRAHRPDAHQRQRGCQDSQHGEHGSSNPAPPRVPGDALRLQPALQSLVLRA